MVRDGHDVFDVYVAALDDTNQINSRRQSIDSLYTTIVTLILSGDVYLAVSSGFRSWFGAFATAGVMVAGLSVIHNWSRAQTELDVILAVRYKFLRDLEVREELQKIGANLVTQEYKAVYKERESTKTKTAAKRLELSFRVMFVAVALAVLLLTFASMSPLVGEWAPWLQQALRDFSLTAQP